MCGDEYGLHLQLREWAIAMMIAPYIWFLCVLGNDHCVPFHKLHLYVFYMPEAMLMTYDQSSSYIYFLCRQLRQSPWPVLCYFCQLFLPVP